MAGKRARTPTACGTPKRMRLCDGAVLHFPGALNARDLAALGDLVNSPETRAKLRDATMHDASTSQYGSRRCDTAWLAFDTLPSARKLKLIVKAAQDEWELLPFSSRSLVSFDHTLVFPSRSSAGALRCTYEDVQYTEYLSTRNAHFKQWHVDAEDGGADAEDAREITLVVLLSDPGTDFEGGAFEVMTPQYPGGRKAKIALRRGDAIAFPAKQLWHRVMPTTVGTRKSLVVWAKAPY